MTEKDDRPWKIPRPKGMAEYILRECQWRNYLIFDKRLNRGVCTGCNEEFPVDEMILVHCTDERVSTYCPKCGRAVIPKEARYGRKRLADRGRIIWSRAYGAVTIIEVDEFIIDYSTPHPSVWYNPVEQIRMSKKEQKRWDYSPGGWFCPAQWYEVKKINIRPAANTYGFSDWHDHLWIEQMEFGKDCQYLNKDPERFDYRGCFDEDRKAARFIRYMSDFLKYPAIELLEKAGFEKLVVMRADGYASKGVNIQGKTLRKILRVGKKDLKKLRELDPLPGFMDRLWEIRRFLPDAEIEEIDDLSEIHGHILQDKQRLIKRYADEWTVVRYLKAIREEGERRWNLSDYADYLEAILYLGERIDKKGLFPNDFDIAHDEMVCAAEELRDREKNEKADSEHKGFGTTNWKTAGMEEPFALGDLLIRPATEPQELRTESRVLSHCVRTYIDRVAEGRTSILFIRRKEKPDRPYFTLELSPDGHVIQCRGDHNRSCPEDVNAFIGAWQEWMGKNRKRRQASA
jgi:hypothetical protein